LKESIRTNGTEGEDKDVYFDMTVQEKNITFSTDDKPAKKIIKKCLKTAESNDLKLRQTYTRTLKKRSYDQRFCNHPQNKGKAGEADKKVKTIAGRLVRDLERKSGEKASDYKEVLELSKRVLAQKRNDKDKIYSLHEPEVCCINKGKEHKPCEFGNKASFGWTASGVIVSALVFRNEYDGHTLDKSIEQEGRLRESLPENGIGDRGYRGRGKVGETVIHIPKPFSKKLSVYMQRKEKKYFRKRAGIEPVISHLKAGRRLSRNFYKGIFGDNINMMPAATGFNFKRMMNKWKASFLSFGRCCFKK
jgi:IS5 family transposase